MRKPRGKRPRILLDAKSDGMSCPILACDEELTENLERAIEAWREEHGDCHKMAFTARLTWMTDKAVGECREV